MYSYELEQMFDKDLDSLNESILSLSKNGHTLRDRIKNICIAESPSISAAKNIATSVVTSSYDHDIANKVNKKIATLGKTYIPNIIRNKVPIKVVSAKVNTSNWIMLYKDKLYTFTLQYDDSGVRLVLFNEIDITKFVYPKDVIEYTISIAKPDHSIKFNKNSITIGYLNETLSIDKGTCERVSNYINSKYQYKLFASVGDRWNSIRIKKMLFGKEK